MLLALDISITCTGYSIFKNGQLYTFGIIKTTNKDNIYTRLAYLENEILKLISNSNISNIVIEAPSYGSRGAMSYQLFGVHFSIVRILTKKFKFIKMLNIAKIKKFATGNGRAKKSDMLNALPLEIKEKFNKLGVKKTTGLYDLTDSYFIGKLWLKEN